MTEKVISVRFRLLLTNIQLIFFGGGCIHRLEDSERTACQQNARCTGTHSLQELTVLVSKQKKLPVDAGLCVLIRQASYTLQLYRRFISDFLNGQL